MTHYLENLTSGRYEVPISFRIKSENHSVIISLGPGDTKDAFEPIPDHLADHPKLLSGVSRGRLRLLTEEQYEKRRIALGGTSLVTPSFVNRQGSPPSTADIDQLHAKLKSETLQRQRADQFAQKAHERIEELEETVIELRETIDVMAAQGPTAAAADPEPDPEPAYDPDPVPTADPPQSGLASQDEYAQMNMRAKREYIRGDLVQGIDPDAEDKINLVSNGRSVEDYGRWLADQP